MSSFLDLIPTCAYCGRALSKYSRTIDHIHPLSKGGEDIPENKISACRSCNQAKGSLTLVEWKLELESKLRQLQGISSMKIAKYKKWLDHINLIRNQCL